jgi:hypothetical protein
MLYSEIIAVCSDFASNEVIVFDCVVFCVELYDTTGWPLQRSLQYTVRAERTVSEC